MTTIIGKVLAVFTAVVGVAFLGFVAVSVIGGPNWEARLQSDDLRDYVFEPSEGAPTTWSVKRLFGDKAVGGSTQIAPQAIVSARTDLKAKQSSEMETLEDDLKDWQGQLDKAKKFIAADVNGLEQRLADLDKELADLNAKIEQVSGEVTEKAKQVRAKQTEAALRQEDIRLYEAQLEELRTDRFRALEQQKILRDQLVRIRGANDRLERRNEELKQATTSP